MCGQVSVRELAVVSQVLVTEVRKVQGVGAIGMGEIREMLAHEYRRQMLGCQADQECLAEIAGALGVDELVPSELVVDGGTSTLSVSRIEIRTARVLTRFHGRLARQKAGEEVLGALGEAVAALYPDRPLRAGEQRGVAPEVARWLNPPPLPRWTVFATAGSRSRSSRAAPWDRIPAARASPSTTSRSGSGTPRCREATDRRRSCRAARTSGCDRVPRLSEEPRTPPRRSARDPLPGRERRGGPARR